MYDTENIGDEIQSIAARRFLPKIDYYVNRDHLNDFKPKEKSVKVIMNSWYMAPPYNWPPKSKKIDPLLISMYVERFNEHNLTDQAFLSDESKKYIAKHGPFGARDTGTMEFMNKHGIESYFSGCMTLTLLPDKKVKRKNYVLVVDVPKRVLNKIKKSTKRPIITLNTERYTGLTYDEKMKIAEYWLTVYQSAHCVVTTRLHCMLPCLALGTPVYAIRKTDMRRFGGLIDLTNNYSEREFIKKKINFDRPSRNPRKYEKIRDELVKKCKEFTGFDSKKSYLYGAKYTDFIDNYDYISGVNKIAEASYKGERRVKILEDELADVRRENKELSDLAFRPGIMRSIKNLIKAILRKITRKG